MEVVGHKSVGSGKEKVLVLHNWFGDSTTYDSMIPYLDTDNFTYLFMDIRGYGRSKDLRGSYSLDEITSDAIKLVDSLSWDKFHAIGHSMCGIVVQKLALDNFSRVKSVIAITPVPASGSAAGKEIMSFLEGAAVDSDSNAVDAVNLLTGGRYANINFAKKMVSDWRNCSTKDARLNYLRMFVNTDFSQSANGLKTPMLALYSEHDWEVNEELLRNTFLKWYPNARIECSKAVGHYPMIESPITLASTFEKFLLEHSSK